MNVKNAISGLSLQVRTECLMNRYINVTTLPSAGDNNNIHVQLNAAEKKGDNCISDVDLFSYS